MKLILPLIKTEFPFIGSRVAQEDDFYEACERHNIKVIRTSDVRRGLYIKHRFGEFIFLNDRLNGLELLRVAFHELGHALLHAPSRSVVAEFFDVHYHRRHELEAEAFAALLLILPSDSAELLQEADNPANVHLIELIKIRLELMKKGI
jgi:Zn-dependent peptidase ImmA (M78 family)